MDFLPSNTCVCWGLISGHPNPKVWIAGTLQKLLLNLFFFSHWKNTKGKGGVFNNLITLAFTYFAYADSKTQLKVTYIEGDIKMFHLLLLYVF